MTPLIVPQSRPSRASFNVESVVDALRAGGFNPRRFGIKWKSGCPVCLRIEGDAGDDRLRVHMLGNILITKCNRCEARSPKSGPGPIWAALGVASGPVKRADPGPPPVSDAAKDAAVARMIDAAVPVGSRTAARWYLTYRWAWPPPHVAGAVDPPDDLLWLPASRFGPCPDLKWFGPPSGLAGVLAAIFRLHGKPVGVSVEGLLANGRRPDWCGGVRWRRTFGRRPPGSAFWVCTEGEGVHVAEGELTALSILHSEQYSGGRVAACGSDAGLRSFTPEHRTTIWMDGDPAGESAGTALLLNAASAGKRELRTVRADAGRDALDGLKAAVTARGGWNTYMRRLNR